MKDDKMVTISEYKRKYFIIIEAVENVIIVLYKHPVAFWRWRPALMRLVSCYEALETETLENRWKKLN